MNIDPTAAAQKIIETGVLGALLILAIAGMVYFFLAWKKLKEDGEKKTEQTVVVLKAVNDTMKDLLVSVERQPNHAVREKKHKNS